MRASCISKLRFSEIWWVSCIVLIPATKWKGIAISCFLLGVSKTDQTVRCSKLISFSCSPICLYLIYWYLRGLSSSNIILSQIQSFTFSFSFISPHSHLLVILVIPMSGNSLLIDVSGSDSHYVRLFNDNVLDNLVSTFIFYVLLPLTSSLSKFDDFPLNLKFGCLVYIYKKAKYWLYGIKVRIQI